MNTLAQETIDELTVLAEYILEDFENASLFLQTVYAIEKILAGLNVHVNESVFNLTAESRYAADDVTWKHTAFSTFLHN